MLNRHAVECLIALTKISSALACRATGVAVDSRIVKPGDIFIALSGEKVDGHDYLQDAFKNGAIASIVSQAYSGNNILPLIKVEDPLQFLQELAQGVLKRSNATIVAVTGSVGKTTTKHFISHLLSQKYVTASSPGNSNSQIGLPLSILNHTQGDEEVIVLEMGMTHAGQIANLVNIAPPDIAVITAVGLVHACNFENLEEIAKSKAEILSHPITRLGIIHKSIPFYETITKQNPCSIISYGNEKNLSDYSLVNKGQTYLLLEKGVAGLEFDQLNVPGKHNLDNFMAAVIVARQIGMAWPEISDRMKSLTLPQKRLQIIEKNGIMFVDDSYNASLLSMKAAIDSMPQPKTGRSKIAVFGPMAELGKFSEQCHYEVADYALSQVDRLYCFGAECLPMQECWKNAGKEIDFFMHRQELVKMLKEIIKNGDVVLIKGSFSSEAWKIFEEI